MENTEIRMYTEKKNHIPVLCKGCLDIFQEKQNKSNRLGNMQYMSSIKCMTDLNLVPYLMV